MKSFEQHVEPIGRGRVRFRIHRYDDVEAYQQGRLVSRNFVASTGNGSYGWWGRWHLTHLPTGRLAGVYGLRSFSDAKKIAAQLERLVDWRRIRKGSRRLRGQVDAIMARYEARAQRGARG